VARKRIHFLAFAVIINLRWQDIHLLLRREKRGETYVNFVIQRTDIKLRAVCTPTHTGHRATYFERGQALFPSIVSRLPDLHSAIVGARREELSAGSCSCPVKTVDDSTMSADFSFPLPGGDIRRTQGLVSGYGVNRRR
jgi:hypothetical protein